MILIELCAALMNMALTMLIYQLDADTLTHPFETQKHNILAILIEYGLRRIKFNKSKPR